MANRSDVKRYNLSLPTELFEQIETIAETEQVTVLEVIRRFIKLGLIAHRIDKTPDAALLIREGATEREIVFL